MLRNTLAFIFFLCGAQFLFGQNPDTIRVNSDCPKAKEISVLDIYRPPLFPKGAGKIYEYENEVLLSLERFEVERNSA